MDLNAFERKVRYDDVRFVRFLYCDTSGIIRGKSVHIDKLIERTRGGIGLTVAMPAMNMLDQLQPVEGLGPVGEIRLVPDIDTYTRLPYAPHSAAMMANMVGPLKGRSPVVIWYIMQPRLNRSARPSTFSPLACSGAM